MFGTLLVVEIDNYFISVPNMTILTAIRSVRAFCSEMSSKVLAVDVLIAYEWYHNAVTNNSILALIWTRNFLVITTISRCFMSVKVPKLAYPFAAFIALGTVDIKLTNFAFETFVIDVFELVSFGAAVRTALILTESMRNDVVKHDPQ